ncbi:MAG: alpha/beta hydrolase [Candidatus Heimdallarchaeota archaeon]|nr:alpha/beta hydrolase [Candidatus Heimdallarchaeota archaeon]
MTVAENSQGETLRIRSSTDVDKFVLSFRQDAPTFYAEGVCNVFYVPVEGGQLRVFHHKPKKVKAKRPIVFVPGFGTTPWSWQEFHRAHHGLAEYFYIETRDKKSSIIKRNRKTDMTIERLAKDVAEVIDYLGLRDKDFVLIATCLSGGALLTGLIKKTLKAPTVVVFDPFTKWTQNRFVVKFIMPILPPIFLTVFKKIIGMLIIANMKNKAQKERNMDTIESAVAWKWRKFSMQNVNFDITNEFQTIEQVVYVFHGPKDKYHPEGTFEHVAKAIPNAHFFLMKTSDALRELLVGVIATEFAFITKEDGIPTSLREFEVPL